MFNSKYVCSTHRTVNKDCDNLPGDCNTLVFGYRWRPPKKKNDRAWKRIAKGDYLWDDKAVAKKAKANERYRNRNLYSGKLGHALRSEREARIQARKERHSAYFLEKYGISEDEWWKTEPFKTESGD